MKKINLLAETLAFLKKHDLSETDVLWVTENYYDANNQKMVTGKYKWNEFSRVAKGVNYNNGFGATQITSSVQIIGLEFMIRRYEYDGSEGWEILRIADTQKMPIIKATLIDED